MSAKVDTYYFPVPKTILALGKAQLFFQKSPSVRRARSTNILTKVRIDKWLWSVRVFKSRTMATDACKSGKVRIGEAAAKPADMVGEGQKVFVRKEGFELQFLVKKTIDKRVGAAIAQECYENLTPAEEMLKFADWFVGKSGTEQRERGAGRPTKRERRDIDDFKGGRFEDLFE